MASPPPRAVATFSKAIRIRACSTASSIATWRRRVSSVEIFSASQIRCSSSQYRTGTRHGQFGRPGSRPASSQGGPPGSPLGSCRIGAGLFSQTAAWRPQSSSRPSGASRARRRTPAEPRQDSSIRVSARSDSGTASPANTPGGFVLWELRSTKFLISKSVKSRPESALADAIDTLFDTLFDTLSLRGHALATGPETGKQVTTLAETVATGQIVWSHPGRLVH